MRTVKWSALIGKSIYRTKFVLFEPVVIEKWLKLIGIGIIAGTLAMGSFLGDSLRSSDSTDESEKTIQNSEMKTSDKEDEKSTGTEKINERKQEVKKHYKKPTNEHWPFLNRKSCCSSMEALLFFAGCG